MDVQQLTMPKRQAKEKLAYVRKQLHRRADAEYAQLEVAYRAAAQGKPLIVLSQAIASAPRDAKGRPRIAIARADRVQVQMRTQRAAVNYRSVARGMSFYQIRPGAGVEIGVQLQGMDPSIADGYSLVPLIPPDVRGVHALNTSFILWEVEQWADSIINLQPDRDPLLLKHLGGDLYAVVAEWDLTDIERAIMAGRARS